jgi:ABC-type uncharacterized transport system permease subunit
MLPYILTIVVMVFAGTLSYLTVGEQSEQPEEVSE